MFRSIYQGIVEVFGTNSRRKAPRRARYSGSRRLAMESLESRKLMTVTTLTLNSISDGSFEAPTLAARAYQIAPASSPWQFSGDTGVSANGSGFTASNPNAPNGNQVAFLKDNASMIQTVYLQAGVYNLSFLAAQRVSSQTQNQELEVLVDGAEVGLIVPAGSTYSPYQTSNFTVTAGTHSVEFFGYESAEQRQHRLHRRSGDRAGGRHAPRWRFRAAGPGRKYPRDRSQWHALAVLRNGRRGNQHWELDGSPERPGGNAGRLPPRDRQHEPDRVPGHWHL